MSMARRFTFVFAFTAVFAGMSAAGASCETNTARAACGRGPRLTAEEFFRSHVDTGIPGLEGIAGKAACGDLAGAGRIFADHVRRSLRPAAVNRDWLEKTYSRQELADLERSAAQTLDYCFKAAGAGWHRFEDRKIDWTFNPTFNGYREWPWQFNRTEFWTTLAECYTQTHDEKLVACWIDQIDSWFDQAQAPEHTNPYRPCTWRSIDAGIRMCEWSRQLHAFIRSPLLTDEFIVRYFRSIWEHGRRLETSSQGRGNWVIIEKTGLLHTALLYPYFRESSRWRDLALSQLEGELDRQVYPDGFQAELTTGYQGVLTDYYGRVIRLYRCMGLPVPDGMMERFYRLWNIYPRLMMPDGRTPNLNDGSRCDVAKEMQAALKYAPERDDWRWFATGGAEGEAPGYLSYVFPWAGAAVMRTGWDRRAVWAYMDGSPFGMGHQHEDKLNILLQAYGKDMITEGGCYFYDTSEMRAYVLSTRAHNTIRIDGMDQCAMATYAWKDGDIARKADIRYGISPVLDWVEASYTAGYGNPGTKRDGLDMTVHSRRLFFFKTVPGLSPFFAVVDRLAAPDARRRTYETIWHLETSRLELDGSSFRADFGDGVHLAAATSDHAAPFVNMEGVTEPCFQGWMPVWKPGPHEHRAIPTPVSRGVFEGAKRVVTILHPHEAGVSPVVAVKASEDVSATSFEIVLGDGTRVELGEEAAK